MLSRTGGIPMDRKKILIIEDHSDDVQQFSNHLKSKGFEIVTAKNGFEGIYLFDKESPDLVLLDWNMPGLSGEQICQNFKKKKNHVPVIVVGSQTIIDQKHFCSQSGCDDFLKKPCDLNELQNHVQNLIQKSTVAAKEKLIYGDLVLDREAHRLLRAGKSIDVSITEYTLLEYLLENMDKVVTRKMILEHVWGTSNPETFTNIVDVYINYLRKKIDIPGKRSTIKTVRGFGYMIEDLEQKKAA